MSDDDFEPVYELERRFLVHDTSIVQSASWELITQAYIFSSDGYAIRVRRIQKPAGAHLPEGKAWLTGKGPRHGAKREEYDLEVSPVWADQVIQRCANVVRKRRYQLITDQPWDIDEFLDDNDGLWIGELEGGQEIFEVRMPAWASRELMNEPRFNNEEIARRPYSNWIEDERH